MFDNQQERSAASDFNGCSMIFYYFYYKMSHIVEEKLIIPQIFM